MKIRQAKKLLTKWGRWELPFEMRTKVAKAARYRYRHRARCERKRDRSRKSCLATTGPVKIWVGDQFLGYAKSVSISPAPAIDPSYIEWQQQIITEIVISLNIPLEIISHR